MFSVDVVTSASGALSRMESTSYDALIADYQMPEMDGIEFLKQVRSSGNRIPFILFTGRGREEIVIQALNEGADFYLQKGGAPQAQFAELQSKILQSIYRRQAEERVVYLSRINSLLSQVNKNIVHIPTRNELFKAICAVAIEYGKFRMAWIGTIDRKSRRINPVASAGMGTREYLSHVALLADDIPEGRGPTGRAVREGRPVVTNDIRQDPAMILWHETAEKFGYRSSGAFPICCRGEVIGAFSLYASEPEFFSPEEVALLEEVAEEISFALDNLEREKERFAAVEALARSEERLKFALEGANDGLWDVWMETGEVYLSPRGCEILGYTPEELPEIARVWNDLVYPDDLPRTRAELDAYLEGRTDIFSIEQRLITKTGEPKWILTRGKASVRNDQGRVLRMTGTHSDITEQKKAENELRTANEHLTALEEEIRAQYDALAEHQKALATSEEKYRSVLNNIQDMFYRSDRLGNLIMASPSCLKTLGYDSFDEILNKPISETFYYFPEKRKELLLHLDEKGSVEDYEVPLKRRDGSIVWTSTNSHYYRDGTGAIAGVEGIFRDITLRKSYEEALKREAAQLDQIINLVPHMIFATDPAGNFLLVNQAVARSYNKSVSEIVGKPQADFQRDAAELRRMLDDNREVITSGTSRFIPEETFTDAFGKKHYLQTTKVPFTTLGNNQKAVLGVAIDITERKRIEEELLRKNEALAASYEQLTATEEELRFNFDELIQREQALKESEERYRNVVEDQTEFISRCQPDGVHVFANEAYSRYYGRKRDDIVGHRFRPDIPVEDKERVKQFFASLTPDHPVDVIEHRVIMPDGTLRWQQWTDRAIFNSSGEVTEYQSVGRDITERKLEEQALQENEQRLTSIYNTVGDSIFQLAVESHGQYRFTSVNSAFCRTTGLPPGQVIGKNVNEIIPEPSLLLVLEKYRQAVEEKAIVRWEETSHYPSGQLTGEVSIAPIFDPAGNCTYLIGSVHDITERKHAEEELRERNSLMRALIDNLPFDTWAMDRSGQYILQNLVSIKNWGDSIGKTPGQIHLRNDLLEKWQENNRKAFEGTVVRDELSVSSKNGVRIYDEIIAPIRSGDVITGIIGVNIDITERKQAHEAQLLATKKLKLLTSITRHDINNQILALQSYLALMEMKRPDPAFDEYFRKTRIAAERISAMIQFTKEYEVIGMKNPGWENCRTLVETAATQVPLANIRLENDIPAGTKVFADPLIVRVFYNLMDNAVRYGKTITTIRFSVRKSDDGLVILCEDDGKGVPADEKEKIFERGFGKNTGLGLFLSREILSITGITIQETGEPGKGARFEIIVPQGSFRSRG